MADVHEEFVERRRGDARWRHWRTPLLLVLALGFGFGNYLAVRALQVPSANKAEIHRLCLVINTENQTIRDIVDHSISTPQYDPDKLSPEAKRILALFAAAMSPRAGTTEFRTYVYAHTPIGHC